MKYHKPIGLVILSAVLVVVSNAQASSTTTQLQYNDPYERPTQQFQYPGNPFGNGNGK